VTADATSRRARRGFVRRHRLLTTLALVVAALLAATSVLFLWPATDQPQHVDAIVSLDGINEGAREATAVSLAEKGYAKVLLFSQGFARSTPCPVVPAVSVVCFEPNPARTVGEIEWAAGYAHRHRLHSLMIVAGSTQVTRARLLMRECFSGRVVMIPAPIALRDIPYEVIYEWGALVKAEVFDRHC
jgi:hypothetical protein